MGSPFERDVTGAKIAAVFWSHALIIIGIWLAYRCREYIIMATAICVLIMSTTYHMVQLRMFDMKDISLFWVGDYSTNYNMVLAIEMYLYNIKKRTQAAILALTPLVLVFLGELLHESIVLWVLLLTYFFIFFFIHAIYMVEHHKTVWIINTRTVAFTCFMSIYLAIAIFFLYWAGNPGDRYYFWPHVGGWHPLIFIGFAIFMFYIWFFYCRVVQKVSSSTENGGTPLLEAGAESEAKLLLPTTVNMNVLPNTMIYRPAPQMTVSDWPTSNPLAL